MSPRPGSFLPTTFLGLALLAHMAATLGAREALAQQERQRLAYMHGRVVDKSSHAGVPRATIALSSDGRTVTTDSMGRYVFANLPSGSIRFVIRAGGFPATHLITDVRVGEGFERTIELDSTAAGMTPHPLLPMVTAAAPVVSYGLVDFERRRHTGQGQYLSDEEIQKSGAANLQDATRGMRGIALHCGGTPNVIGGNGCRIQMIRAPMNCQPQYVVDDRVDNMFGPSTPIRDIVALEVYAGPTDVPGEFAGSSAGCGVVVIWTRAGPLRRRP